MHGNIIDSSIMRTAVIKNRNAVLDHSRGMAALFVVISHVIMKYEGYDNNVFYNICFSLQIPLFMLVSGFSTSYSKDIENISTLAAHLKKRLKALLLPWLVWSFVYWSLIVNKTFLDHINYTAFHMTQAYWFLFSLWTIDVLFSFSSYISHKVFRKHGLRLSCCIFLMLVGGAILIFLAKLMGGIDFLGIKYSIYYLPFFVIGYCINNLKIYQKQLFVKNRSALWFLSLLYFVYILSNYSIISLPDASYFIVVRITSSLAGCFCVVELIRVLYASSKQWYRPLITYCGMYSLEIYVIHCVILKLFPKNGMIINSVDGFENCIFQMIIIIVLTYLLNEIIHSNKYSRFLFYGK